MRVGAAAQAQVVEMSLVFLFLLLMAQGRQGRGDRAYAANKVQLLF